MAQLLPSSEMAGGNEKGDGEETEMVADGAAFRVRARAAAARFDAFPASARAAAAAEAAAEAGGRLPYVPPEDLGRFTGDVRGLLRGAFAAPAPVPAGFDEEAAIKREEKDGEEAEEREEEAAAAGAPFLPPLRLRLGEAGGDRADPPIVPSFLAATAARPLLPLVVADAAALAPDRPPPGLRGNLGGEATAEEDDELFGLPRPFPLLPYPPLPALLEPGLAPGSPEVVLLLLLLLPNP